MGTAAPQLPANAGLGAGALAHAASVQPRLLTRPMAAKYLSISIWSLIDLENAGHLRRVRLPVGERDLRVVLYDKADLDRLVDASREEPA